MSEFLKSVDPEVPLESGFRSATSLCLGLLYPVFALMADPQHEHHFVLFKQRVDNQMPLCAGMTQTGGVISCRKRAMWGWFDKRRKLLSSSRL